MKASPIIQKLYAIVCMLAQEGLYPIDFASILLSAWLGPSKTNHLLYHDPTQRIEYQSSS